MSNDPRRIRERWLGLLGVTAAVWFGWRLVQLSFFKAFSLDEFLYAHAAWLVSEGWIPYVDFFDFHFPLVYQVLAPTFWLTGSEPIHTSLLRVPMLLCAALAALAAWRIAREVSPAAGITAVILSGAVWPHASFATEIRPDAISLPLFAFSVAAWLIDPWSLRTRALVSGVCWGLAAWGTQKAIVYGLPVVLLAAWDAFRPDERRLVLEPRAFFAGCLSVGAAVLAYLATTGSLSAWLEHCFGWARSYQQGYPGFSPARYFVPLVLEPFWWLLGLALLGFAHAARRALRGSGGAVDVLLVATAVTAWLSFALQTAPYPYSMLPGLWICIVLGGRATGLVLQAAARLSRRGMLHELALTAVITVGCGLLLHEADALHARVLSPVHQTSRSHQEAIWRRLSTLTDPGDAVYDLSGAYVTRPHASRPFFVDLFTMQAVRPDTVQAQIRRAGATVLLDDARMLALPPGALDYLMSHFHTIEPGIRIYGERFALSDGQTALFDPIQAGRYFVTPARAARHLHIDGHGPAGTVLTFADTRPKQLAWTGPSEPFHVLWLPRNDQTFAPDPASARKLTVMAQLFPLP